MKKANVALPIVLIVLLFVVVRPLGTAMPETTVFVDPGQSNVEVGQTFGVNVSITNVSELVGIDFLLSYNATILELVNVDQGPFMKSVGPTFMVNLTAEGLVWLAVVLLDPPGHMPSASGSGVLATLTFKAMATGESLLDLFSKDPYKPDEVKLAADPSADVASIPNVAIDGHVVVSPDPDPPKITIESLVIIARHFGANRGEPNFDPSCDLNGDGRIGLIDLAAAAMRVQV